MLAKTTPIEVDFGFVYPFFKSSSPPQFAMNNPDDSAAPQATSAPATKADTNGLGIAGFAISILGFMCWPVAPLGLLLSAIALLKRPRGFAIAGTIIGLVGSALLAFLGVAIVTGAMTAFKNNETNEALYVASDRIDDYEFDNDELPNGIEGNKLIFDITDAWENPIRYDFDADTYEIRSSGQDGKFDTEDDIIYTPYYDYEDDEDGTTDANVGEPEVGIQLPAELEADDPETIEEAPGEEAAFEENAAEEKVEVEEEEPAAAVAE